MTHEIAVITLYHDQAFHRTTQFLNLLSMASKLTQNLTEATVLDSANDRVPIFSAASPSELRYMTPANLAPTISDASTTVKGKVELATDAETITGTDTARAITPSNLTAKMDTDGTLAGNLDTRIPSQKAVKTYADRALNTLLTRIPLYAPQGFLINGKISVTDAAGITVAIKTLAGTDPSATDPVYVRIGDTVRTISAALSHSVADGTNWLNAGSAELATKEIDYFVYLGYAALDSAVHIGFSRIPSAALVSDIAAGTTNEKGSCWNGSIAGTDTCENIGRFAATLSAGAGYTWTVPTYTAINLIQRPIYETRWLTWVPTLSTGGTAPTYTTDFINRYKISSDKCLVSGDWSNDAGGTAGTGAALNVTFPFTISASAISASNRGIVAIGNSYESAGTICGIIIQRDSATGRNPQIANITTGVGLGGQDQSSAVRYLAFAGQYEI